VPEPAGGYGLVARQWRRLLARTARRGGGYGAGSLRARTGGSTAVGGAASSGGVAHPAGGYGAVALPGTSGSSASPPQFGDTRTHLPGGSRLSDRRKSIRTGHNMGRRRRIAGKKPKRNERRRRFGRRRFFLPERGNRGHKLPPLCALQFPMNLDGWQSGMQRPGVGAVRWNRANSPASSHGQSGPWSFSCCAKLVRGDYRVLRGGLTSLPLSYLR